MNPIEKTIDTILSSVGLTRSSKAAIPSVASSGSGDPFAIWRPGGGNKVSADKALDVFTGWTYACIKAIADEIAGMQFELYKVKKDGDTERIYTHNMLDVLAGANATSTGMELLYTITTHLEACGNAYIYLDGVKNDTDEPKSLHILNPGRMRVMLTKDFPTRISHYEYRIGVSDRSFQPYEILHIKYADPQNQFEGIGTVQAVAQWIDADNYAMEFNRRFFLNGARIGGFLESTAARTPEQLEYLKKSFENIYKGVDNAHKILALPKDTVYKEGGQTQKDLDFANMMDMMRDRILAGFRVPRTVLGITDDVNRANAEATNYVFALRTIKPKMQVIVAYLNEFLVPRYGEDLIVSFTDPVPENRDQKIAEMTAAVGGAPVMSVNEARENYFGLEPIEGGDDVSKPFNFLTMGKPKPKATNRPGTKSIAGRNKIKTPQAKRAEARTTLSEEIAQKAADALKEIVKTTAEAKKKGLQNATDEEFEGVYKGFVVRVTPYETAMKEAVRTFNKDQKEEVLKNLASAVKKQRSGKIKAVDTEALFDTDEWISILFKLTGPIMSNLFSKEGTEAAALLGFDNLDPLTPEVQKALDRAMELMAEKYNETTLDLLKTQLEAGIEEGLGIEELKGRVADVYEFSDDARAARVARTETFRVANAATKEAWNQTGVVHSVKWYTAADERVCPWCDPMHGEVIDIKENFFDKGDSHEGSDGQVMALDYDDVGAPPLHVDCRCYIRPEDISV
jgi:HK97 family phage portal protein